MKLLYQYDVETKKYLRAFSVEDNYQPQGDSETFVPLPDGIGLPAYFMGDHWEGTPLEQIAKKGAEQANLYLSRHPELTKPSQDTVLINSLAEQVATLTAQVNQLKPKEANAND